MKKPRSRLHRFMDTKTTAIDRFSDLPEPIIHYIISFLPTKDATKTCALSKRFRSAWCSFPIIEFDLRLDFQSGRYHYSLEEFLNFVRDSLQRRTPNISLQKFRLHTSTASKSEARINNAIRFAIENNVNELDLDLDFKAITSRIIYYDLPLCVFYAKSIKILRLKGFKLETPELIITYPSIEYLSFIGCSGVKSLRVSCAKLKNMEINICGGLEKIDVVAINLESFSYTGKISKNSETNNEEAEPCEINIAASTSPMNLSLKNAAVTGEWFKHHVSKLCLLEILRVSACNMLKNLYFSSDSLKTMEIEKCSGLQTIDAVALNLETFLYDGQSRPCEINIKGCRLLKKLYLDGANITDQWVENNVSEFPFLENLKLTSCNVLQKFKIFHKVLKSLELIRCNKLEEIEVDARSIVSFNYSGNLMPSSPLIDSPQLCAKLSVNTDAPTHDWFRKLKVFLGGFDHCKELTIASQSEKILTVPREVRENLLPPLFDIKHLKVEVSSKNITNLVESLLWITPHPDSISIISFCGENSIKFAYAKPATDEEDPSCCWSRPIKCWRHYLHVVILENFDNVEYLRLRKFFMRNAMRLIEENILRR